MHEERIILILRKRIENSTINILDKIINPSVEEIINLKIKR